MVALASLAPIHLSSRNSPQPESPQTNLRKSQATRGSKRLKRQSLGNAVLTDQQQQQQRSPLLACHEDPSFIYCHSIRSLSGSGKQWKPPTATTTSFPQASKLQSDNSEDYNSSISEDSLLSSLTQLSGPSSCSSVLSRRRNLNSEEIGRTGAGSDYASASPGCISALDYWHLNSDSPPKRRHQRHCLQPQASNLVFLDNQLVSKQHRQEQQQQEEPQREDQQDALAKVADSVYLDDGQVFQNLILREGAELRRRQLQLLNRQPQHWKPLEGERRHSLLSWMLRVCEHQLCQDEIFPLGSQILDKFLLLQPTPNYVRTKDHKRELGANREDNGEDEDDDEDEVFRCDERELERRQLYLFAACSLLLAAKLRQTPRLAVQSLMEFSRLELPVELTRAEILEGEMLLLARLKWDLASLVTPNDFLVLLLRKCRRLLASHEDEGSPIVLANQQTRPMPRCDEARVRRHTQTLLELCLMDSQLSQNPPSMLAMSSMAVAIDGLSMNEKTCWRLEEIVTQIYEITHKVNELKSMIDVALKIEKYVQTLLNSTHND